MHLLIFKCFQCAHAYVLFFVDNCVFVEDIRSSLTELLNSVLAKNEERDAILMQKKNQNYVFFTLHEFFVSMLKNNVISIPTSFRNQIFKHTNAISF